MFKVRMFSMLLYRGPEAKKNATKNVNEIDSNHVNVIESKVACLIVCRMRLSDRIFEYGYSMDFRINMSQRMRQKIFLFGLKILNY